MNIKEGITRLKGDGTIHQDKSLLAKVINNCFQSVLTRESISKDGTVEDTEVDIQEIRQTIESLDIRKAPGPTVSYWIISVRSDKLLEKMLFKLINREQNPTRLEEQTLC